MPTSYHKKNLIYKTKQRGLYQNKVTSNLVCLMITTTKKRLFTYHVGAWQDPFPQKSSWHPTLPFHGHYDLDIKHTKSDHCCCNVSLTLCLLDSSEIFRLNIGQISFNLVQNAFATLQPAFLAHGIRIYNILARACAEIKILRWEIKILDEKVTYVFRLFDFGLFSPFPFCCSWLTFYWAWLRLKSSKEASSRRAICTMEQPGVVAWNFALSFSLNFLSIFVHTCISGSIRPITLIRASLERSFPPAEVE